MYYKNSAGEYVKVESFVVSKSNDRGNSSVVVTANLEDGKTATYVSETTVSSTQQNQQNKPNSSGGSTTTTVNNSTQFYWVQGSSFSSAGTAEHIDIGLSLSATLKIGTETITENLILTQSDITSGDFTVTATYGGETFTGFTVDTSNIETSSGASGITQYRVGGSYPVGTITTPVYYTVTLKKNVTFTTKDGTTYTVPMTFSSTFQYWDSDNDCPGLSSGDDKQNKPEGSEQESNYTKWQKGSFISGSGLDFLLGSSDYTKVENGRIQITKNVTGYEVTEESYTFYIYDSTGTLVETLVVAVGADELGVSFSNLLEYGTYYIVEANAELTGYSVVTSYTGGTMVDYQNGKACQVVIDSSNKEIVVTCANAYTRESVNVEGSKTWTDSDNQDNLRPGSITINLLADGSKVDSKIVTAADNWSWSFSDLDKYDADGKEIVYAITEDAVDGYTTMVNGYHVTNSHTPEKTSVSGSKTWNDAENQDGKRPASITINLLANGEQVASKTVTATDNWAWEFSGLDKYADGKMIIYTITENTVSGYETSVTGYNVTNSYTPEKTSVSGSKTWNDADNQDGKRPGSITIHLYANGTKVDSQTVTAADNWAWTFTDLDKYVGGKEITYTISEDAVENYSSSVNGFEVTNTYTPETVSVIGAKDWDDANNQDGKRPSSITIKLLADGKEIQSQTVTASDNWQWNFTNLPKYANGKEITYTISESEVSDYKTTINGYNVTNSYTPETISISGSKTWKDAENQDGKRPGSITINLLADGEIVASKSVSAADGWKWTFDNLAKYKAGKEIVYTISENAVNGYSTKIEGYDVTNSYTPETTSVSGSKTWDDAKNQDGKRPESITINLLADGKQVDSKTVTAADDWNWEFENLPVYKSGTKITYTITEDEVADYVSSISGYNVTNTHNPETVEISGSKTWVDGNNQNNTRPESITIRLLANGAEVQSANVTAADNWAWAFTKLDRYKGGEEIEYTVTEDAVAGYSTSINGMAVTNTLEDPEDVSVSGTKTWADGGKTHDNAKEIVITLYRTSTQTGAAEEKLDAVPTWSGDTYTFADLEKYDADGYEYTYRVEEEPITAYDSAQSGNNFTNTLRTGTFELKVTKELTGRTLEADQFTFAVTLDGEEVATAKNAADGTVTFEVPFPVYEGDKTYTYQIVEKDTGLNGYEYDDQVVEVNVTVGIDENDSTNLVATKIEYKESLLTKAGNFLKQLVGAGTEDLPTFTNKYTITSPANATISGTKKVTGTDTENWHDGWFTFTMTPVADAAGTALDGAKAETVKNDGDSFSFDLTYDHDDLKVDGSWVTSRDFYYEITETEVHDAFTKDNQKFIVKVTVSDHGDGTMEASEPEVLSGGNEVVFTNDYKTVTHDFEFTGTKTLIGHELTAGQFDFEIIYPDGSKEVVTNGVENDAQAIKFQVDNLTAENYPYEPEFLIREVVAPEMEAQGYVFSKQQYKVTLTIADNGDGTYDTELKSMELVVDADGEEVEHAVDAIAFTNHYKVTGNVTFGGRKMLDGRAAADADVFTFVLKKDGEAIDETAVSLAQNAGFELKDAFDQNDIGKEFTYQISEKSSGQTIDGVTYDTTVYTGGYKIVDEENGTLSAEFVRGDMLENLTFTNVYKRGNASFAPVIEKHMSGRDFRGTDKYTFTAIRTAPEGEKRTEQVTIAPQNGKVFAAAFSTDVFGMDDIGKTYGYEIYEEKGDINKVTYDTTHYLVNVTITDDGNENLTATAVLADADDTVFEKAVFTNVYKSGSGNNPGGGNGGGSDSGSDDGGSTSGGHGTTITPGDVPLSSLPSNGYVEIMEEEVPLGALPKTGRANANANAIMLLISSLMMAAVAVTGKKKDEEQQ